MTNNRAVSEGTTGRIVIAAFLLCCHFATAFQSTAPLVPLLKPPSSPTIEDGTDGYGRINYNRALRRQQCRREQVLRAAADMTAMDDMFPSAEVFFPSPDVPKDAGATRDRIQNKFRRMKKRLKNGKKRRAFKKLFLSPTKAIVKKRMRIVNDIFATRHSSTSHDNNIDSNNHSATSVSSTIAPEAMESTMESTTAAADDVRDTVTLSSVVSEEKKYEIETPTESAEIVSAQAAMLTPAAETAALPLDAETTTAAAVSTSISAQAAMLTPAAETVAPPSDTETTTDAAVSTSIAPKGDRWAISAPGVDMSGKWELIVTNEFKRHYDRYLERLGQPKIVRSVALSAPVIGQTMEEMIQTDCGRSLLIRGKNVRGTWERTLEASGTTRKEDDYTPLKVPIRTIDGEEVESEAWWESDGTIHMSWMRGITMYGGGSFVSRRYVEETEDETVYVCESTFVFNDPKKEDNSLAWRFRRMAN